MPIFTSRCTARSRRIITRVVSALAVGSALAGLPLTASSAAVQHSQGRGGAAPDNQSNQGHYECLLNDLSQCWDVKNGRVEDAADVWLYNRNSGNALGWETVQPDKTKVTATYPFTDRDLDAQYLGDTVYQFVKTTSLGILSELCLGEQDSEVQLRACGSSTGTLWVVQGNTLINVTRSDVAQTGLGLIAFGAADESQLYVGTTGTGTWFRWHIFAPLS